MAIPVAVKGAMTLSRAVAGRGLSSIREVFNPMMLYRDRNRGGLPFPVMGDDGNPLRSWNTAAFVTAGLVGNEAGKRLQDRAKVRKRDQIRV